jgi:hypothetical protein
MKEKLVKNVGNIGLLVFSAGIWLNVLIGKKIGDGGGRAWHPVSLALIAIGVAGVIAHIVLRRRAKKTDAEEDE